MTLAEKIQTARTEAGLTPLELASRVGVTRRAVSFWENGEREPSVRLLVKIAEATGRTISWFVEEAVA